MPKTLTWVEHNYILLHRVGSYNQSLQNQIKLLIILVIYVHRVGDIVFG